LAELQHGCRFALEVLSALNRRQPGGRLESWALEKIFPHYFALSSTRRNASQRYIRYSISLHGELGDTCPFQLLRKWKAKINSASRQLSGRRD